jgi:hypothetical protein
MACPVNHPFFHALVFLLGIIVVLSRYARAEHSMMAPLIAPSMAYLDMVPSAGSCATSGNLVGGGSI